MMYDVVAALQPLCRVKRPAVDLSAARENVTWGFRCAARCLSVCGFA